MLLQLLQGAVAEPPRARYYFSRLRRQGARGVHKRFLVRLPLWRETRLRRSILARPGQVIRFRAPAERKPVACATQKQTSRRAPRRTGARRQAHWCFEGCFPLTPALPRGGRIVRRAVANPERLDSSQRGRRSPLSLRERVRVRGSEVQPIKTTGRILQARFDRLPETSCLPRLGTRC